MPHRRSRRMGSVVVAVFLSAILVGWPEAARTQQGGEQAEPIYPPELVRDLEKLRDAALESDYAWRQLAHLTNNIGPRLSASPQAEKAVEYVAAEMRRLGLEVTLQNVVVPHWVRGVETGELVEFPGQAVGTTQKIVLTALGGSVATPADGLTADVVVVHSFDELDQLGADKVRGRMVLFNVAFDEKLAAVGRAMDAYGQAVVYRGRGASAAAEKGAVASFVRSVGSADYRLPHTGAMGGPGSEGAAPIPAAAVTAEDADLMEFLTKQGRVRMHLVLTPQLLPDAPSHNVIADLKGSEHPEQVVVVSGHLDSWDLGTGAIDDGAGIAVAMESANLMTKLGLRPKRTLRVIAWMNEENGGRGSRAYASDYQAQFANHVGAIESDAGAGHPAGFYAKVSEAAFPWLRPVSRVLQPIGATVIQAVTRSPGADITPLADTGVPAFGLMQDTRKYFDYHHTAADTLDKVNSRELAENAAVMAVLSYALAAMEKPLPR